MIQLAPGTKRGSSAHSAELLDRLCGDGEPPRVLMVVAHPDDEVIGAGVRLPWLRENVTIVHVTDGAPAEMRDALQAGFSSAEGYSTGRRQELLTALQLVGVSEKQTIQLGFKDQAVVHHITEVAEALAALIQEHEPELVLTHPYEGGHPDHDAVALAVRMAVTQVAAGLKGVRLVPPHPNPLPRGEGTAGERAPTFDSTSCGSSARQTGNARSREQRDSILPLPKGEAEERVSISSADQSSTGVSVILEMSSYHLGPEGLHSGDFLPVHTRTRSLPLTSEERALKQQLFACFRTQQHVLRWFRTDVEAFRVAPEYDFAQPPHPGTLCYEQFKIGMTWREWRAHANAALHQFAIA
jgi:LmbE family N-acetylglucosaminyl deacetylase